MIAFVAIHAAVFVLKLENPIMDLRNCKFLMIENKKEYQKRRRKK